MLIDDAHALVKSALKNTTGDVGYKFMYDFVREVESFIIENQLKMYTMARYTAHLKEERCDRCRRPFFHYLKSREAR